MESISSTLAVVLGLILRIGIPVLVTILFVAWFRRLDARWQKEAEAELARAPVRLPGNTGCWKVHGCPPEKRSRCKAYNHPESPCWQVFRDKEGRLRESCFGCDVFRKAPIPVSAGD